MQQTAIDVSGAVTMWSLKSTRRDKLAEDLKALDLAKFLPEDRTPKAVLFEVLREKYQTKTRLVRPLAKRSAFTIVDEKRGNDGNDYTNGMLVEVTDDGLIKATPGHDEDAIIAAYMMAKNFLPAATLGGVLANIVMGAMSGVALRPSGGVYWVPADRLETWIKVANAVEAAAVGTNTNSVHLLRTKADAATLRAIKDAITTEIAGELERMNTEIMSGTLGSRALETKLREAEALHGKLTAYEALLGETLSTIHDTLEAVKMAAGNAAILASAKGGV